LERKARRLLWEYGSGETPQAQTPRRLAETPTESEVLGEEINRQFNKGYTLNILKVAIIYRERLK
jgi:hypothetical protein